MSGSTTLLLTAVGSLVARGVLDVLEGRRDGLRVVGCGSDPTVLDRRRCDAFHHVPATDAVGWEDALRHVLAVERPEAVVPGRDHDVRALARLAATRPDLDRVLLAGSADLAAALDDKAAVAAFARRHDLPHVPTVVTDDPDAAEAAAALLAAHGFPLISKPRDGNGSRGVRVVTDHEQLATAVATPGLVVQPFLDTPAGVPLRPDLTGGAPLFWDVPEDHLYGVQTLIARDGTLLGALAFRTWHVRGRPVRVDVRDDPDLLALGTACAAAATVEGWRGPLNVQTKRDGAGGYRIIELNGRFTGGTSGRLLLGFDEVRLLLDDLVGRPVLAPSDVVPVRRVDRIPVDVPVTDP